MLTVIAYILLETFTPDWSEWLLVMPIFYDVAIWYWMNSIEKRGNKKIESRNK